MRTTELTTEQVLALKAVHAKIKEAEWLLMTDPALSECRRPTIKFSTGGAALKLGVATKRALTLLSRVNNNIQPLIKSHAKQ
jgi:hypothetical protein